MNMNCVRNSNLMSVFYDIYQNSPSTRGNISERTGLSVVTVSKCVLSLLKLHLISEYSCCNYQLGRNAGLLEVAKDSLFLVIDLSGKNYEWCYINLCGKFIQRDFHFHNPTFILEDNLRAFLNSVREKIKSLKNYKLLNIGVILPDTTDKYYINSHNKISHHFNFIDINKIIKESLCTEKFITEHFIFCAFQTIKDKFEIQPDSIYIYLSMMSDYPSACVLGSLKPTLLCIGDIPVSPVLNYSQVLKMSLELELLKRYTTSALCSVVSIIAPKVVLLIDDNYTFTSFDIAKIEKDVRSRTASEVKIAQYKNDFAILGFVKHLTESLFNT